MSLGCFDDQLKIWNRSLFISHATKYSSLAILRQVVIQFMSCFLYSSTAIIANPWNRIENTHVNLDLNKGKARFQTQCAYTIHRTLADLATIPNKWNDTGWINPKQWIFKLKRGWNPFSLYVYNYSHGSTIDQIFCKINEREWMEKISFSRSKKSCEQVAECLSYNEVCVGKSIYWRTLSVSAVWYCRVKHPKPKNNRRKERQMHKRLFDWWFKSMMKGSYTVDIPLNKQQQNVWLIIKPL